MSTDSSAERSSAVSGTDRQAASSPPRIPARNSGSTERLWLKRSISYALISAPCPRGVRMTVIDLLLEYVRRPGADGAEHGYPVQQFPADVAGLPHPGRGRLRDELGGLPGPQPAGDVRAPLGVGDAGDRVVGDTRAADLQGEAAARDQ